MKNLDLGVREHSPSAATTSKMTSAQEVCDPFETSTRPPHSVLFGAWICDDIPVSITAGTGQRSALL